MRRRHLIAAVSAIALFGAGLAAGCGSEGTTSASPETVVGKVPQQSTTTTTTPTSQGDATAGKAVFASSGCGGCHTLKAANATGTVGPNLDEKKPPLPLIIDRVTNGKSPMPAFGQTLSQKQIQDVAAFVYQSTHS
jgi:mono/diheme cytochrome c family protein